MEKVIGILALFLLIGFGQVALEGVGHGIEAVWHVAHRPEWKCNADCQRLWIGTAYAAHDDCLDRVRSDNGGVGAVPAKACDDALRAGLAQINENSPKPASYR